MNSNANVQLNEYHDIIKTTIDREHMYNDVISFNKSVINWIDENEVKLKKYHQNTDDYSDDEIIIVDDHKLDQNLPKTKIKIESDDRFTSGDVMIPMDEKSADECFWINEICREIDIKLLPEKIADNVVYPAAQKVLQIALRSFLEDLLRKSYSMKFNNQSKTIFNSIINRDDILQTLSRIKMFDFLTNRHLGVEK